jgi:hypothetical protein
MWFLLGVLSAVNSQAYLAASAHFPRTVFARVSTAINLMAFLGAFGVQWGLGVLLDVLGGAGWSPPGALGAAFAALIVLQGASLVPLLSGGRRPVQRTA